VHQEPHYTSLLIFPRPCSELVLSKTRSQESTFRHQKFNIVKTELKKSRKKTITILIWHPNFLLIYEDRQKVRVYNYKAANNCIECLRAFHPSSLVGIKGVKDVRLIGNWRG